LDPKIVAQVQMQRNQFADAHAVAAARAETLADELDQLRGLNAALNEQLAAANLRIEELEEGMNPPRPANDEEIPF
jgi:predicted  nucleic acid-binding Zn-ribbon protein